MPIPGVGVHRLRPDGVVRNPEDEVSDDEDAGWIKPQPEQKDLKSPGASNPPSNRGLAEWAASVSSFYVWKGRLTNSVQHIIPLLPPPPPPPPPFTVERLRLTIRRAFLVFASIYNPYLVRALDLATWKEPRTSLKYCVVRHFASSSYQNTQMLFFLRSIGSSGIMTFCSPGL